MEVLRLIKDGSLIRCFSYSKSCSCYSAIDNFFIYFQAFLGFILFILYKIITNTFKQELLKNLDRKALLRPISKWATVCKQFPNGLYLPLYHGCKIKRAEFLNWIYCNIRNKFTYNIYFKVLHDYIFHYYFVYYNVL